MTSSAPSTPEGSGTQTIARAAQVLACFSAERPHLKLVELSELLGLSQSTTYRYLAALESGGLVIRDPQQGGYRLGLKVIELAGIAINQIEARKHALDDMDQLSADTGLLVNLAVLFEGDVLHIAHVAPPGCREASPRSAAVPSPTAPRSGKAMLAGLSDAQVHAIIDRYGWRPYTDHSIRDFARLDAELARTRAVGYALDLGERRPGVVCAGSAIRDFSGHAAAAVSVSVADNRYDPEAFEAEIAPQVLAAAERISFRMGHQSTSAFL